MKVNRVRLVLSAAIAAGVLAAPVASLPAHAEQPPVTPRLTVSAPTAAVGTWVDYTVTGTPARSAWGQRVRVLVKSRDSWLPIGTMQFDKAGLAHGRVTGREPGVGHYIAQVLTSSGKASAQSAIASITWTAN